MTTRFIGILSIVFAILLQSGCATIEDAQAKRGTGKVQVYERPVQTVWNSLLEVLGTTSLEVVSADKDKGEILAMRKLKWFSFGENVAIYVEPLQGGASTRVEIVNVKRVETNTNSLDWQTRIFTKLDRALK